LKKHWKISFAVLVIGFGCWLVTKPKESNQAHPGTPIVDLQAEFNERVLKAKVNNQLKDGWDQETKILQELLNELSPADRQKQLERLIQSPGTSRTNEFSSSLEREFIWRLAKSNDTNGLQKLLTSNGPTWPVEIDLARSMNCDGISVLTAAYRAVAKDSASRKDLLECLNRAFPKLRKQYPSDSDFTDSCERWIKVNHDKCTLNPFYPYY
jgi:hypothetical protein